VESPDVSLPSDAELLAFLEEGLPASQMAALESRLRQDASLLQRLAELRTMRDVGLHSIGGIWRSHRLSCPTRQQLSNFLMDVLDRAEADYLRFHIERIGCRFCQASLDDLRQRAEEASREPSRRRSQKYFQTSVGRLRKN
jgi:hypothetical protein